MNYVRRWRVPGNDRGGIKSDAGRGIEALAEKAMSAAVNRAKELAKGG